MAQTRIKDKRIFPHLRANRKYDEYFPAARSAFEDFLVEDYEQYFS